MLVRLCLKFFKLVFSRCEPRTPSYTPGFEKGIGSRDQMATFVGSQGKQRNATKNIYFCYIDYTETFDCVRCKNNNNNCVKFLKRWKNQTTLPVSQETCMWVKKQQVEPYLEQLTGSKLVRSRMKLYIFTVLFNFNVVCALRTP